MENKFLGKGWSFPPEFFNGGAEVSMVAGEEDIRQSLQIILSTSLNERIMHSDFGAELNNFLFEERSQRLITEIHTAVSSALLIQEPRIVIEEVTIKDAKEEEGLIHISVDYTVRATNNRFNLVYPYYLNEAVI